MTAAEGLVEIDGERYYRMADTDRLAPFLMSVVSDGDRWMFVSSGGALTAGRGDASRALFPYVTDDRLHAAAGATGPVTCVRDVATGAVWRPFDPRPEVGITRWVAKAVVGHAVVFEEHHPALGLTVAYRWSSADGIGFVRAVTVTNHRREPVRLDVLDGLLDVLPAGLDPLLYSRFSNLTHAYKRSELVDPSTGLAVFSLEAPISDRAEPEEVLRATVVWSIGFDGRVVVLDAGAVAAFDVGDTDCDADRSLLTGVPGAYLLRGELEVGAGSSTSWHVVADVDQDHTAVASLLQRLRHGVAAQELDAGTRRTGEQLARITALADAAQHTGDPVACAHHVANVTYNVMRGGVPLAGYRIDTSDFAVFVRRRNRTVADRHGAWFTALPPTIERRDLVASIAEVGDVHLTRLGDEYVPFSFSRRHGDPSRPWNQFAIRVATDDGRPIVYYEGNWRDVFQNWEATCASFPEYLPGVVAMFVDASTADGHNPYRITRDGIDWEVPDPDDPWANIGYWGDHQIVYLLRLLEASDRYLPEEIARRLAIASCTYADVPYRIVSYDEMIADPKATIRFDHDVAARVAERVAAVGGDGTMTVGADGEIVVVSLFEKLLVSALAKLSNFVPGGGIWMNTQRPEWNDANNALVGFGTSMVTLFHLRRFLDHVLGLADGLADDVPVSAEVAVWLTDVVDAFDAPRSALREIPTVIAGRLMDRLGRAATTYRSAIYDLGFSGSTVPVGRAAVAGLHAAVAAHLDATIRASVRPDGLVHAYRLVHFPADDVAVLDDLPEMLEGQVAALTPGLLRPTEQADLVDALFASALFRPDQRSFVLSPPRPLPSFLDKNVIPPEHIERNGLLGELVAAGDRSIVVVDAQGVHRFAPALVTEADLGSALDRLASSDRWAPLVERCRSTTLDTYETVFRHRSYVGRSGSMYAYEGIGSIYWHMVTKLLLAIQEAAAAAADAGADEHTVARLVAGYRRVRDGLGFNTTGAEFGAIPIDPYSHTPAHAGAQQPGMTGAVKEEILARPRELGVRVDAGRLGFDSLFLDPSELLEDDASWSIVNVEGEVDTVDLPAGSLGLTVCGVPIVVGVAAGPATIDVRYTDGRRQRFSGRWLGHRDSAAVFGRTGEIRRITASIPPTPA
jgi:hypothetical protein